MAGINVHKINPDRHPMLTSSQEMRQFLAPLSRYGVIFFGYIRSYPDGERICLPSHPSSPMHVIKERLYRYAFCSNMQNYRSFNYMWVAEDCPKLFQAFREHRLGDGITLIRQHQRYCEISHFAGEVTDSTMGNFFINNICLLENFILDFRKRGITIIKNAEKQKLIYTGTSPERDIICKNLKKCLIEERTSWIGGHTPKEHGKLFSDLSHKELECARYMCTIHGARSLSKGDR